MPHAQQSEASRPRGGLRSYRSLGRLPLRLPSRGSVSSALFFFISLGYLKMHGVCLDGKDGLSQAETRQEALSTSNAFAVHVSISPGTRKME